MLNRYKSGELWSADSIARPDSLKYETLRNHRPVYGGGGIIPDVFVPADTSYYSAYYRDLIAKGVVNRTVINYVDANRKSLLNEYPTAADFEKGYAIPDELLEKLLQGPRTAVERLQRRPRPYQRPRALQRPAKRHGPITQQYPTQHHKPGLPLREPGLESFLGLQYC